MGSLDVLSGAIAAIQCVIERAGASHDRERWLYCVQFAIEERCTKIGPGDCPGGVAGKGCTLVAQLGAHSRAELHSAARTACSIPVYVIDS
jgi:hypothetical protein